MRFTVFLGVFSAAAGNGDNGAPGEREKEEDEYVTCLKPIRVKVV